MLPKSILYPVDFSDQCRATAPAVASLGASLKIPVKLLHSIDFGQTDVDAVELSGEFDAIRCHFEKKLRQFALPQLPSASRELVLGPVAASIVHCAENMDSPLIMMPTRGHTRFRQLMLGSVTAAVLHDAAAPVWTAAHSAEGTAPESVARRGILCAVDLGPHTRCVMMAAREFSAHFGVPWYVVHSIPLIDPRFRSAPAARAHLLAVELAQDEFRDLSREGSGARFEIGEGSTVTAGILDSLGKHACDLLVIGRGTIQGPLGRLRSGAYALIRSSPCPVLSV